MARYTNLLRARTPYAQYPKRPVDSAATPWTGSDGSSHGGSRPLGRSDRPWGGFDCQRQALFGCRVRPLRGEHLRRRAYAARGPGFALDVLTFRAWRPWAARLVRMPPGLERRRLL